MKAVSAPNVRVYCVPIESKLVRQYKETFGSPGTWDGSIKEFRRYVEAARALRDCDGCVDVVIVDGRARADCAIEILPYLRPDSEVFVHDWIESRMGAPDKYAKVLDYYQLVDVVRIPAKNAGRAASGLACLRPDPAARARARRRVGLPQEPAAPAPRRPPRRRRPGEEN